LKSSLTHASNLALASAVLFAASAASAATFCVSPSAQNGCKATISAAVAAASAGDLIQVGPGTYNEQVIITKPLSLLAASSTQPIINAKGQSNGIFINGMATLPLPGVANVIVSGFVVENANFEGILVANASNITLVGNHVLNNNKSLNTSAQTCPGIPGFETSEQSDCGEGIHLMATDHSTLLRNEIESNSGGVLITDETGPTTSNLIKGNNVHDNPYACGITMASHPAANASKATGGAPYGITHNVIADNESHHNGLGLPGAGAGVGIFAPGPGNISAANVVIHNELYDNGLPGVTMHNHFSLPAPVPQPNLNDNQIIGNHIYGNAADTADAHTAGPTGINILSTAPITGIVIAQNTFSDESINIAFSAPGGFFEVHFNDFNDKTIGIQNTGGATINATENWWDCPNLPYGYCSSTVGSGITTTPSLTQAF
jgi:nitrous oxidase accessory protein NosD